MNKEEIKNRLAELQMELNKRVSNGMLLSEEDVNFLDKIYSEMTELKFTLRALDEDGSK